jgi:hypothetical protein
LPAVRRALLTRLAAVVRLQCPKCRAVIIPHRLE